MQEHAYDIDSFIFALSEIPASDPLVHSDAARRDVLVTAVPFGERTTVAVDSSWNALLKTAALNKRESDLDSLCCAFALVEWEYKGRNVHSPLVLVPVTWKVLKGKQQLELKTDPAEAFINPFVRNQLVRNFGVAIAETAERTPELLVQTVRELIDNHQLPVTIHSFFGIGNFHHHRYQILRELELIQQAPQYSPLVQTILGNESARTTEQLQLAPGLLSPADTDQLAVFQMLQTGNTVIQGPPGTGKSQVLTNLIGKMLTHDELTLVVSEKRVALDVLVKKLGDFGLDAFTFTVHSQSQPKDLIRQLKASWNLLEQDFEHIPAPLLLSDQLKDALQLLLDRLNSPDLMGGVSFAEFSSLTAQTPETTVFHSDAPDLRTWLAQRPALHELEKQLGSFTLLSVYKQQLLSSPQLDQLLRQLERETRFACETFGIRTFGELERLYRSAARCQLVVNESFRQYFDLYKKPRERKRFDKVRLQFRDLLHRIELAAAEKNLWKVPPSRSEAVSWLTQLNSTTSWWKRRKAQKNTKAALNATTVDPQTALTSWLDYLSLQEQLADARLQLAEWGIERPEVELASAAYVLNQLEQEDPNELNRVAALPASERQRLLANGERLKQLVHELQRYLIVHDNTDLTILFEQTETRIDMLPGAVPLIRELPESVYRLLSTGKSLNELHAIVLHSNRRLVEMRFPELAKFDGKTLEGKLENILSTERSEFEHYARYLLYQRKQRFERYATLLRTPAAQLKGDEKLLKARLKAGKAILVKEFGKSKQHQTIRELLSGEARIWIELLTPVWLSTPAQVGKTFPMVQNLFELAIFDEASQMPLPNALGALQRSKRAIVAGDEQQMAPTSYFSGATVAIDLLHQASWYWKKVPLKHHYRSEHPALIAFSNNHFYRNELVAYPIAKAHYPLFRHFVPNGTFDERTNAEEAKALAAFLETLNWKKSIGIVAFSEQQLECIWQYCSPEVQEKITAGQEKNTVFFKALEQVQGDEADIVVIGLGYAKNPDGAFHLRFGPLNQSQGYKRLNVLLTRAKSELHFFTSVEAKDFALSANESVNLLRLFLTQLEQSRAEQETVWPYGLIPLRQNGHALTLKAIYAQIVSAQELVTFHRVMQARGWKLNYQ